METRTRAKGFTLIEVMITIAIVGILAAVASSSYENYRIRARMTEALSYASQVKLDATAHYQFYRKFAHSGGSHNRKLVKGSDVVYAIEHWAPNDQTTAIHIYMQPTAFPGATIEHALILRGTPNNGGVIWECVPHGGFRTIPAQYAPPTCQ